MALLAGDASVLSGKRKAGLAVVNGFPLGVPVNQGKIDSVVIGVTPGTLFAAGRISLHPESVHAVVLRDSVADLCMTFKAFELLSAAANSMTLGAVCRS
jgi:hypothetical protein